jgi:hypothetical protein
VAALLERLAADPAADVREAVVWALDRRVRPGADALLDRLAVDPAQQVRQAVADLRED